MSLCIVRDNPMNACRQQTRAKQSQDRAGNNVPEENAPAALTPRRRNSAEQLITLVQANRRRTQNTQQRKQAHRNISREDDGKLNATSNWKKTRADITKKVSDFGKKIPNRTRKPQGATGTYGE